MSDLRRAIERHVRTIHAEEVGTPPPIINKPPAPQRKVGWMKAKILGFVLGLVGQKLDGKKVYLAGAAFMLLGVVGVIGSMFPDQGLPKMEVAESWSYMASGWALIAGRNTAQKLLDKIETKGGEPCGNDLN